MFKMMGSMTIFDRNVSLFPCVEARVNTNMGINVLNIVQWRSQNAEKDMHIKGRLLDQVVILFNYIPSLLFS